MKTEDFMKADDFELIKKFNAGDEKSFETLVKNYSANIYAFIYRLAGNSQDTEDILQIVWINVYNSLKKFRFKSSFFTYLYRIALNTSLRYLQKRKSLQKSEQNSIKQMNEFTEDDPLIEMENKEITSKINKAIEKLPSKQKTVFILRNYHNLSYEEIGTIINSNPKNAKANYFYALKNLQETLTKEGIL